MGQRFVQPIEEETACVLDRLSAERCEEATREGLHPSAVDGISRFGFEGSYTIDEVIDERDMQQAMRRVLRSLNPREERVIRLLFGFAAEPLGLDEVGRQFSVTSGCVRQIEAKALRKLKHPSRSRALRSFLDGKTKPARWAPARRASKPPEPSAPVFHDTEVNGQQVRVFVKHWSYDPKYAAHFGKSGPFVVFDHDGQEYVGESHEMKLVGGTA